MFSFPREFLFFLEGVRGKPGNCLFARDNLYEEHIFWAQLQGANPKAGWLNIQPLIAFLSSICLARCKSGEFASRELRGK
jgi:hypothetical protein